MRFAIRTSEIRGASREAGQDREAQGGGRPRGPKRSKERQSRSGGGCRQQDRWPPKRTAAARLLPDEPRHGRTPAPAPRISPAILQTSTPPDLICHSLARFRPGRLSAPPILDPGGPERLQAASAVAWLTRMAGRRCWPREGPERLASEWELFWAGKSRWKPNGWKPTVRHASSPPTQQRAAMGSQSAAARKDRGIYGARWPPSPPPLRPRLIGQPGPRWPGRVRFPADWERGAAVSPLASGSDGKRLELSRRRQ